MEQEQKVQNWWSTLPGILTGTGAVITAIGGLILALNQSGFLAGKGSTPLPQSDPAKKEISNAPITSALEAPKVDPIITTPILNLRKIISKSINLLTAENGGHLAVASSDDWSATIDGKEDWQQISSGIGQEAVYAFEGEQPATFDKFTMLISETADSNIEEFELLESNDSPTGKFNSIGKFQTKNLKTFKTPYQEFTFSPVTAKYLKFKLISSYGFLHPQAYEFQLFGSQN